MNYKLDESFTWGGPGMFLSRRPHARAHLWIDRRRRLVGIEMSDTGEPPTGSPYVRIRLPHDVDRDRIANIIRTGRQCTGGLIDYIIEQSEHDSAPAQVRLGNTLRKHAFTPEEAELCMIAELRRNLPSVACKRHADLDSPEEVQPTLDIA